MGKRQDYGIGQPLPRISISHHHLDRSCSSSFELIITPLSIHVITCWRKDSSPQVARVLQTAAHADRLGSSSSLSPSHGLVIISCQQFNQSAVNFQEETPPMSRPEFRTETVLDELAFIMFSDL